IKKSKSVQSGKTIEQVAKAESRVWNSNRSNGTENKKTSPRKKSATRKKSTTSRKSAGPAKPGGKRAKFPTKLSPMLATLVDKPFDEEGWTYEVKWDGYRAIGFINKGKVELRSRNDKSFNEKFYPVYDALKNWNINAVVDGEIIVANEEGISDFSNLQQWRSEDDGHLRFYIFDILWLNGYSLVDLPLSERRKILEDVMPAESDTLFLSEQFNASGTEFFQLAEKMELEGIIAKKEDSDYKPGIRSKEWLKIKTAKRQEVVIGGYTKNEGSSKAFSSLLVGVFGEG